MSTIPLKPNTPLNAKHEAFCRAVVSGSSQGQAYIDAGYSAKNRNTADANAARLIGNDKIRARLKELQAKAAEKLVVTAEGQYAKLEEIRRLASKDGAHSASVAAVVAQNRLFGLEKVVTETTVRMASRRPDVPKEVELSVEEWQRQQSALLPGNGGMDGDERDASINRNGSSGNGNAKRMAKLGSGVTEGGDGHAFAHDDHRDDSGDGNSHRDNNGFNSHRETVGSYRPGPSIIDMYDDDDDD